MVDGNIVGTAVIAPSADDDTNSAYLAMTPEVYRGAGARQAANLR
jgi:hypothetical protein